MILSVFILGLLFTYFQFKGWEELISNNIVTLPANVSSQYVSSLMMLGVTVNKGLKIKFSTKITSLPYIHMTKKIIERMGGIVDVKPNVLLEVYSGLEFDGICFYGVK